MRRVRDNALRGGTGFPPFPSMNPNDRQWICTPKRRSRQNPVCCARLSVENAFFFCRSAVTSAPRRQRRGRASFRVGRPANRNIGAANCGGGSRSSAAGRGQRTPSTASAIRFFTSGFASLIGVPGVPEPLPSFVRMARPWGRVPFPSARTPALQRLPDRRRFAMPTPLSRRRAAPLGYIVNIHCIPRFSPSAD